MFSKSILIAAVTFLSLPVHGHVGDRLIPVFEISDDVIDDIDIHDGSIEDWLSVVGEPSITGLEFTGVGLSDGVGVYNPSDFDFRVWLGWNATHRRIYVSAQAADDLYVRNRSDTRGSDLLIFNVDGDHSGEPYVFFGGEEEKNMIQAQQYSAPAIGSGPEAALDFFCYCPDGYADWVDDPPYADGGEGAIGENPTLWHVEFYVTPFDELIWDDQERSVVSELA